jgi:hypothetical protein
MKKVDVNSGASIGTSVKFEGFRYPDKSKNVQVEFFCVVTMCRQITALSLLERNNS